MKQSHDLKEFTRILAEKGYNGYFHTQGGYPGKLKESMQEYLESCKKGLDDAKPRLLLTTYLQWNGEDQPSVRCCMYVKNKKERFELSRMVISKQNRYGQLLKQVDLTNLTADTAPGSATAIAMVNEPQKQQATFRRGFSL